MGYRMVTDLRSSLFIALKFYLCGNIYIFSNMYTFVFIGKLCLASLYGCVYKNLQ